MSNGRSSCSLYKASSITCNKHPKNHLSCMWYNRLSKYLLKEGYVNNLICPCIFIKKSKTGFAIIVVYVDDLNLVKIPEDLIRIEKYLKKEFEMKDFGKKKNFVSTYRSSISVLEFCSSVIIY